ncbi:MAG: AIR synthase-related protein, partial [Oscillospiraceae bacterium]|nr:AIR synthase-related protein [Oscillospiraceae bacterium]
MLVYRIYVEKKSNLANEAASLLWSLQNLLGIKNLEGLRIFNRYDVENIDGDLFNGCKTTVFSEPQLDDVYDELPEVFGSHIFAVEYLPGQYDQRADSAAQCIQLISQKERPTVRTAKVYMLEGDSIADDITAVKKYIINPVEAREAGLSLPASLELPVSLPEKIEVLDGFINMGDGSADDIIKKYSLAMDKDDVLFCRDYFKNENRDPTLTELKMIDTYWSDHCRHTTFLTVIDGVKIDDPSVKAAYENYLKIKAETGSKKPVTLMDIATIGAKYLRQKGLLESLDISDEINACTVKIDVDVTNKNGLKSVEKWLLLFKNETHNHPTEIEPFGGAATCIGGAIRDPLSGRAYVYQAMRITGAGDSTADINATLPGKLPQRKIATQAAAGYSSYGNQIGLATGIVDEIYHEGYIAKHMELGAVIGAAPLLNVRRETPLPGDVVILLGGRTGRDGCGGATGSSKSHDVTSIETCGAEVQKGNAPEERKIQRFFRNPEVTKLIKRCNDFGAGGVSVAIGELADGLHINLDKVPKKYEGLDGTELAISESQERMAVVLSPGDAEKFKMLAAAENLEATEIAIVKAEKRLTMEWQNEIIVDISRDFLNSNGAEKRTTVEIPIFTANNTDLYGKFNAKYIKLAGDLNICSKRGLSETFDSTIGAGTVLMPFGGKY